MTSRAADCLLPVAVQEELRREHADRVSAQALVEQHQQQLADLKLEASVLRQASAEHARLAHPSHFEVVCKADSVIANVHPGQQHAEM